jgi:hypothetical protein
MMLMERALKLHRRAIEAARDSDDERREPPKDKPASRAR